MLNSQPSYLWRIRTLGQEGQLVDDWVVSEASGFTRSTRRSRLGMSKNDWFVEDHEDIDRFEVSIICGWSDESH